MAKTKVGISDDLKKTILDACSILSQYQRYLESKGKASEATRVKEVKNKLMSYNLDDK